MAVCALLAHFLHNIHCIASYCILFLYTMLYSGKWRTKHIRDLLLNYAFWFSFLPQTQHHQGVVVPSFCFSPNCLYFYPSTATDWNTVQTGQHLVNFRQYFWLHSVCLLLKAGRQSTSLRILKLPFSRFIVVISCLLNLCAVEYWSGSGRSVGSDWQFKRGSAESVRGNRIRLPFASTQFHCRQVQPINRLSAKLHVVHAQCVASR